MWWDQFIRERKIEGIYFFLLLLFCFVCFCFFLFCFVLIFFLFQLPLLQPVPAFAHRFTHRHTELHTHTHTHTELHTHLHTIRICAVRANFYLGTLPEVYKPPKLETKSIGKKFFFAIAGKEISNCYRETHGEKKSKKKLKLNQ